MAGYTPLFNSLTTGTLCGRWPDIGLWPIVLSLADKHGRVDVTPEYIGTVTGLQVAEVVACMKRFCEPDPRSRTGAEKGARLALLDPPRDWGWSIVNHGKYREKARLMGKDAARTASGADAERKRHIRVSPGVPRRPPASPSQTHTHTQTEEGLAGLPKGIPADLWLAWEADRKDRKKVLTKRGRAGQFKFLLTQPEADRATIVQRSIDNGWTGLFQLKAEGQGRPSRPAPRVDRRAD